MHRRQVARQRAGDYSGPCAGLVVGTRKRAPPGTMLELNGGYDESPAEDSDGPAAGRRQRAQNRAGACLVPNASPLRQQALVACHSYQPQRGSCVALLELCPAA